MMGVGGVFFETLENLFRDPSRLDKTVCLAVGSGKKI